MSILGCLEQLHAWLVTLSYAYRKRSNKTAVVVIKKTRLDNAKTLIDVWPFHQNMIHLQVS